MDSDGMSSNIKKKMVFYSQIVNKLTDNVIVKKKKNSFCSCFSDITKLRSCDQKVLDKVRFIESSLTSSIIITAFYFN